MKIKLLDDKILVKPIKGEDKTKAGIHIPEVAKGRPTEGIVIEVGPGSKEYPMIAKKGDKVIFGKHAGVEVMFEDITYLIMRQSDLLAIL